MISEKLGTHTDKSIHSINGRIKHQLMSSQVKSDGMDEKAMTCYCLKA